ncbi:hypothetical protein PLANPX_0454 [Lacipirellula parvula]|uniref:Uncharacterized protein n=1 Tax=Lacipirellula parvula TaxID=2650471 RepID=A0A5K7X4U7_9BACT|nr:hypothetical protein PLANPX_0454 [Lacipirellula parvula]
MDGKIRFSLRVMLLLVAGLAAASYAASLLPGEFWAYFAIALAGGVILGAPQLLIEIPIRVVRAVQRWRSK